MSALVPSYVDRKLVAEGGDEIGTVQDVIVRPSNLRPEWLVVKTGWRRGDHLVPVIAVAEHGDELVVPYSKARVDASPKTKDHVAPPVTQAEETYRHYGLEMPPADAL